MEYTSTSNDFQTSTAPRIVEFYSPTCGACRNFRKHYLELAQEVLKLHAEVEFYGVSCHAHRDVCNHYQVKSMPTLLAFTQNHNQARAVKRGSFLTDGGFSTKSLLEALEFSTSTPNQIPKTTTKTKSITTTAGLRQLEDHDKKQVPIHKKKFVHENADMEQLLDTIKDENDVDVEEDITDEIAESDFEEDLDETEYIAHEEEDNDNVDYNGIQTPSMRKYPGTMNQAEPLRYNNVNQFNKFGPAKQQYNTKSVDQWKDVIAERRQRLALKRQNKKLLETSSKRKQRQDAQLFLGGSSNNPNNVGSTETMLANTPGTRQFEQRKQKIAKQILKIQNRGKLMRKPIPQEDSVIVHDPTKFFSKNALPMQKQLKKPTMVRKGIQQIPVVKRLVRVSPEEELYWDAARSFYAALLRYTFSSDDPLDAKKKQALQSWLELVSVTLPPEWALHELVDDVYSNLDYVSQSHVNLKKILTKHAIPRKGWSPSCNKGNDARGFHCGFWKLLHIVSVGVAEHRGGNNLVEAGMVHAETTRIFSPKQAAATLREYMAHFYGCDECRNRFIAAFDECDFGHCDLLTAQKDSSDPQKWKQFALWIWAVHNDVSVHIANKQENNDSVNIKTITRNEVKALWPSLKTCLICFQENGAWDDAAVFEYLEKTYWYGSVEPKTDRLLVYRKPSSSSSGFFLVVVVLLGVLCWVRRQIRQTSPFVHSTTTASTMLFRRRAKVRKV